MKVRYVSEDGCSGPCDDVIYIPEELLVGRSENDVEDILSGFVCSFGCHECVEYNIVADDTPHTMTAFYDHLFKCLAFNEKGEFESL